MLSILLTLLGHAQAVPTATLEPRLANGLALTPPMGWDSYNHYNCFPNQTIMQSNAKALVDLGLAALGYEYVTTDCGWSTPNRTANGTLTWNATTFPDGFPALGDYLHGLGLKFGVYADAGIQMCSAGSFQVQAGSLNHEQTDADTFAAWGADMLKYDNCYSEASAGYPDADYTPSTSPEPRFQTMTDALLNTGRAILFSICEWGVDFPSAWAPPLGNTWRITNDIIPAWRTVYRQVNQVVSQTVYAGPGHWPDLDMLEVGNNVFSEPEEQTHFTLWAICKSPLIIGAALKDAYTKISASSLAVLKNKNVINYNQDKLGVAANLTRRYSEAGYDVWAGPLSGGRMIAALVNWADYAQTIDFNFADFGVQRANTVKDIWADSHMSDVNTKYSTGVAAHGTTLLELGGTARAGHYNAAHFANVESGRTVFRDVYGVTDSTGYTLVVTFAKKSTAAVDVMVKTSAVNAEVILRVPAHSKTATVQIALVASNTNEVTIEAGHFSIQSIDITNPSGTFYPSTSFTATGSAVAVTCPTGLCAPSGSKIGYLSPTGFANISIPRNESQQYGLYPSFQSTTRYVEIVYCNNEVSLATSWTTGRNARNITVQVNDAAPVRLEVPLSGRSSELFSPADGWDDSATLGVLVDGWGVGSGVDVVSVGNAGGDVGVQSYGADFVGFKVLY